MNSTASGVRSKAKPRAPPRKWHSYRRRASLRTWALPTSRNAQLASSAHQPAALKASSAGPEATGGARWAQRLRAGRTVAGRTSPGVARAGVAGAGVARWGCPDGKKRGRRTRGLITCPAAASRAPKGCGSSRPSVRSGVGGLRGRGTRGGRICAPPSARIAPFGRNRRRVIGGWLLCIRLPLSPAVSTSSFRQRRGSSRPRPRLPRRRLSSQEHHMSNTSIRCRLRLPRRRPPLRPSLLPPAMRAKPNRRLSPGQLWGGRGGRDGRKQRKQRGNTLRCRPRRQM